jgi:hypothetical protein
LGYESLNPPLSPDYDWEHNKLQAQKMEQMNTGVEQNNNFKTVTQENSYLLPLSGLSQLYDQWRN